MYLLVFIELVFFLVHSCILFAPGSAAWVLPNCEYMNRLWLMLTDPEVYFFSNSWWQELVWKSGRRIADINQSTWSSTIKRVFWMRAVWKGLSKDVFSCATQTCAFNREAAQLWKVRKEIHTAESARDSPSQTLADPWKEEISLRYLWKELQRSRSAQSGPCGSQTIYLWNMRTRIHNQKKFIHAPEGAHGRKTIQMWHLWKVFPLEWHVELSQENSFKRQADKMQPLQ